MKAFLSYVAADRTLAERVLDALRLAGINVWHEERIGLTEAWADQVIDAIRSSDFLILIPPKFSDKAANALSELGAARALGKPIVTVVAQPGWYDTAGVAQAISRHLPLDASSLTDSQLVDAIVSRVENLTGRMIVSDILT